MSLRDDELLERAAGLRTEGRAFLDRHEVEARLEHAGRVVLVGSFVTGLMVWRDLDYTVDAPGAEVGVEFVEELVVFAEGRHGGTHGARPRAEGQAQFF